MPSTPCVAAVLRMRDPTEPVHLAVRHLQQQTLLARELVLVGVGVEPASRAIGVPRVGTVPFPVGRHNWATALNRAVASTDSPFLAFTDGNALAAADRLKSQAQFLSRHPQFEFVSGWSESLSLRGSWIRHAFVNTDPEKLLAFLLHHNPFPFGTVMIARACFDDVGGFDERLPAGADHDLWLRIGLRSRLAALPAVMCRHLPRDRRTQNEKEWALPDPRRQLQVQRLVEVHPYGQRVLEEALSRYPEDTVLWTAYSRSKGAARHVGRGAAAVSPEASPCCDGVSADPSSLCLNCLRYPTATARWNELAQEYGRLGNPLLAYLCRLASLAAEPRQCSVFCDAYAAWTRGVADATGLSGDGLVDGGDRCTVSVLVPTYNRAHLLVESLQSVLHQTFRDFELVVLDDGSTDGTEQVVRSLGDPRIRYVHTPHRGVAAALNVGAQHARGRYLAYLGDDDVFYPDHLARAIDALEISGAALVYEQARTLSGRYEDGRFVSECELGPHGEPFDEEELHRDCIIPAMTVLHRRECLAAVGGFDERLPTCEDWDVWVRFSERFPILYVDGVSGEYRRHGGNISAGSPFRSRLLQFLLTGYYETCRGLTILLRAAHLQGRLREHDRLLHALQGSRLFVGETAYEELLSLLHDIPGGSGLIIRLFQFRPRWYLKFFLSRLRMGRWSVATSTPLRLYPSLLRPAIEETLHLGEALRAPFAISPFFWHRCRILAHAASPFRRSLPAIYSPAERRSG